MRKAAEIASAFAPREALDGKTSFFLVGIGGAGMSALARMLKHRGFQVRGTDSTLSPEVERLRTEGFDVIVGHTGDGIVACDAVVLTDAIDLGSSPEVARAKELNAPLFRRSQVLGWLLKPYKVIAITGTHGKTTTTGMTGAGLISAGFDPLVVVGASIPEWGGPVREGKGGWAVVEACEAYDSFHDIDPHTIVLTNLELDHTDFHGNWENLKSSVVRFVSSIRTDKEHGAFIYCGESPGACEVADEVIENTCMPVIPYCAVPLDDGSGNGTPVHQPLPPLQLPGEHNRLNAEGALHACLDAEADEARAAEGIANFRGAERRLQVLYEGDITVIDDYAHHPTELEASLGAVRERMGQVAPSSPNPLLPAGEKGASGRLIVVFQPHLYSRTADNIPGFAQALDEADVIFITDIYPAREAPLPGISSARIAELATKECHYVPSRHLLARKVAAFAKPGDTVVGMGAGNISEFAPFFIEEWQRACSMSSLLMRSNGSLPLASGSQDQAGLGTHEQAAHATRVAVVYGGDSSEREVSLHSGRAIHESLVRQGFQSYLVDVTDILLSKGDLSQFTGNRRPDLAILAVHGAHSEDGAFQGLFELLHIPYTGSGIQASAIAMNKGLTKEILAQNGIRVPEGKLVTKGDDTAGLKAPAVVKPNAEGSTVGLSFVETDDQLKPAIEKALIYGGACLVEEWVRGMEISVPVLGDRALLPVEIAPVSGRYDFASKYTPGATEEIVPARLPQETVEQVQALALKAHEILGCEGATRTDMMLRSLGEGKWEPFVLEVNTLPGMTATSLLPNSALAAGVDFDALVLWLLEDALRRYAAKT